MVPSSCSPWSPWLRPPLLLHPPWARAPFPSSFSTGGERMKQSSNVQQAAGHWPSHGRSPCCTKMGAVAPHLPHLLGVASAPTATSAAGAAYSGATPFLPARPRRLLGVGLRRGDLGARPLRFSPTTGPEFHSSWRSAASDSRSSVAAASPSPASSPPSATQQGTASCLFPLGKDSPSPPPTKCSAVCHKGEAFVFSPVPVQFHPWSPMICIQSHTFPSAEDGERHKDGAQPPDNDDVHDLVGTAATSSRHRRVQRRTSPRLKPMLVNRCVNQFQTSICAQQRTWKKIPHNGRTPLDIKRELKHAGLGESRIKTLPTMSGSMMKDYDATLKVACEETTTML